MEVCALVVAVNFGMMTKSRGCEALIKNIVVLICKVRNCKTLLPNELLQTKDLVNWAGTSKLPMVAQ